MTDQNKTKEFGDLLKSLIMDGEIRGSMFVHGSSQNFSFPSDLVTIYMVPISSCFLIDVIPPNMNNIVFVHSSVEQFQEECSQTKVPINSNIMILTGDWGGTIQIWDVYRPKPDDNIKLVQD